MRKLLAGAISLILVFSLVIISVSAEETVSIVDYDKAITSAENDSILGDMDSDGKVYVKDALLLQDYLIGSLYINLSDPKVADLNADGKVNIVDFSLLKNKILGLPADYFEKRPLMMDDVYALAEKETAITWEDLNNFEGSIDNRTAVYHIYDNRYDIIASFTDEPVPAAVDLMDGLSSYWITLDLNRNSRKQTEAFLNSEHKLPNITVNNIKSGTLTILSHGEEKKHVFNNSGLYYLAAAIKNIFACKEATDEWKSNETEKVRYELEFSDGSTSEILIMSSYIVIDGKGYIASTEECERMTKFAGYSNYFVPEE